jgi:spermidine synthase
MADEVLWTRILVLHLGSSVYSFSLMLAVTLTGIAAGSLAAARLRVSSPARKRLYRTQLALGVVLVVQVAAFLFYSRALVFIGIRVVRASTFLDLLATRALVTALYLGPPAFLSGAAFALVLRVSSENAGSAPKRAGRIYAANTLGAIAGSLAAGFAAIPLLGSQGSLLAVGFLAIAVAAVIEPRSRGPRIAALAALVGAAALPRNGVLLSTGVFSDVPRKDLVEFREDVTATVAVKRYERPAPWLSLELNGVNVAGTSPELVLVQKLQAHLPLALVSHPDRVVHIGFGSGGTAYSASLHPVSRIQVVEISPEVISASAKFFGSVNHGVLRDPRVQVAINDGRNFILATPEHFDAILSDSIHPRYAGNGALYTEEYFRLCSRRLAPGGVVSMWLPMYSLRPEDYRSIVRAFHDAFPNVSIWYAHRKLNSFTIVLATPAPTVTLRDFVAAVSLPSVRADLAEVGEDDPAVLLSNLILAPPAVSAWVETSPPHTDDLPTVEYGSGRVLGYGRTWYATLSDLASRRSRIEDMVAGLSDGDPLSERIRKSFEQAGPVIASQLDSIRRSAATEP